MKKHAKPKLRQVPAHDPPTFEQRVLNAVAGTWTKPNPAQAHEVAQSIVWCVVKAVEAGDSGEEVVGALLAAYGLQAAAFEEFRKLAYPGDAQVEQAAAAQAE